MVRLSRRDFASLCALAVGGGLADRLWAERAVSRFTVAHLRHGGDWNPRPTALRRLLWELGKRTSVEVEADAAAIDICTSDLVYRPFAYCAVQGALPTFEACQRAALRTYLRFGGTVVVDGVEGGLGSTFDRSVREAFEPIAGAPVTPVPRDHVVYKSFYLLDSSAGRIAVRSDLDAIAIDDRLAVIISHNDLGGAWARSNLGLWEHAVEPGGNEQRERAFRLGVNLVMYALCIDYKEDQVHIPFILQKRRRR